NALGGLAGAAADRGYLDFGMGFLKRARFDDGFPAADVDINLAFLLGRFDGFFPFLLPVRLSVRLRQQQQYGTSRQHNSRHRQFSSRAILSVLANSSLAVGAGVKRRESIFCCVAHEEPAFWYLHRLNRSKPG